jgi:hypothetical protein
MESHREIVFERANKVTTKSFLLGDSRSLPTLLVDVCGMYSLIKGSRGSETLCVLSATAL